MDEVEERSAFDGRTEVAEGVDAVRARRDRPVVLARVALGCGLVAAGVAAGIGAAARPFSVDDEDTILDITQFGGLDFDLIGGPAVVAVAGILVACGVRWRAAAVAAAVTLPWWVPRGVQRLGEVPERLGAGGAQYAWAALAALGLLALAVVLVTLTLLEPPRSAWSAEDRPTGPTGPTGPTRPGPDDRLRAPELALALVGLGVLAFSWTRDWALPEARTAFGPAEPTGSVLGRFEPTGAWLIDHATELSCLVLVSLLVVVVVVAAVGHQLGAPIRGTERRDVWLAVAMVIAVQAGRRALVSWGSRQITGDRAQIASAVVSEQLILVAAALVLVFAAQQASVAGTGPVAELSGDGPSPPSSPPARRIGWGRA